MLVYKVYSGEELRLTTIVKEEADGLQASMVSKNEPCEIKTEERKPLDHSKSDASKCYSKTGECVNHGACNLNDGCIKKP